MKLMFAQATKHFSVVGRIVGPVLAVIALLGAPIIVLSQLNAFFYGRAQAYGIYQAFSYSRDVVDTQLGNILTYLRPGVDSRLDQTFFSLEDRLHMEDVKLILSAIFLITVTSFVLALISFACMSRDQRVPFLQQTKRNLMRSLAFLVLVGIVFAIFWDQAFILFHQVLFPYNTYWALDPASSNLIKFFPGGVFRELGVLYLLQILLEYCAIQLAPRLRTLLWHTN